LGQTLSASGENARPVPWSIDGTPPPGFVKKVHYVALMKLPKLAEGSPELEKLQDGMIV